MEEGGRHYVGQRRVQAGAAAWRRVEGIMWDRGECKQEQQRGGEWKALCGTEESASRSSSVEESGRHYVGQRRVQAGAAAWRRVEGIMWDRGECKQEQQRGGEWKALCGTEESASRSSSMEEGGRHVGQRRVQAGVAAWRRVEGIMWDRGECKQEQQRGGEWKALCGTEESASRSGSMEEGGRHYVGQRRVQAGAAAWRRVEGIMWDRGECKQEQQRGGEWKALCGTEESASRSSSVEESARHYVGQRRVQAGAAAWRRVEDIMCDREECKQEWQRGGEWKALCGTEESATGAAAWRRVEGIMWDRGECKQEQQRGGEWKALCGTEESASRSGSMEEGGRHYVGQRRVQAGAAAWRRVEGIMWDRGECKQEQQRGGEWKALCGTEESASRSSSVEESARHYVGQRRVQAGAAAWRRVEDIMCDREECKQEWQRGGEWKALCGTEESATGAAAWRRVEGIMWDRGECKQEWQRGGEWKALCGTEESASRSSSVEESARHYVG